MTSKIRPRWNPTWWTEYSYLNGTRTSFGVGAAVREWTDTFNGTELPNHRQLIAVGQNATTIANGTVIEYNPPTGSAEIEVEYLDAGIKNRKLMKRTGAILGSASPFPAFFISGYNLVDCETQARIKFLQKYRGSRTAFQGGQFLGELHETLMMLKHPALALRRGIDDYYGAVKERARRVAKHKRRKVIADTYLEYAFGWSPLINDIQSAAKLVYDQPKTYLDVISAEVTQALTSVDFRSENATGGGPLVVRFTVKGIGGVSVRYKGAVNATMSQPPSLAEFTGVSLTNFAPTAWELIPYSFLVDYFSNIGNVIDTASLGTVYLSWGVRTERQFFEYTSSAFDLYYPLNTDSHERFIHKSVNASGGRSYQQNFFRSPVGSVEVGILDLTFKIPGIDESRKWLNIGALAAKRRLPFD
jgi:hypothetical protein